MNRDELGDLSAFLGVIEAGSFTKAAARLGTSQSALSHTVARLEARLGRRLLNRTTRRAGPTEAGEQLAATLRPYFDEIEAWLASLSALLDKPAGLVRISSSTLAAEMILWPMIEALARDYPEVRIEVNVESRFTDIVAERFDEGVRLEESVDRDMIAIRIGPDISMALVASPDYLSRHGSPSTPQDLVHYACINLRLPTMDNIYAWEFAQNGRALNVRVEGSFTFNLPGLCLNAARAGLGLAFVLEPYVTQDLTEGHLVRLLTEWCPLFPGFHLYHPSRRHTSAAMALVMGKLRWRS